VTVTQNQYQFLRESTGRLVSQAASGTGFFVSHGVVVTCAHVVAPALAAGLPLEFHTQGRVVRAVIRQILPALTAQHDNGGLTYPYPDLAVVSVRAHGPPLPLITEEPTPGAELYTFGYTDEYPLGDSALFIYEGQTRADGLLYKLKDAQARPGLSGAPLLDVSRGGVVAMVKRTRDKESALGSRAIPITTVVERLPNLSRTSVRFAVATRRRRGAMNAPKASQDRMPKLVPGPESHSDAIDARGLAAGAAANTAALPPRHEFVGRGDKIRQLGEALRSRSPIVAIEGLAGVGKTALALEVVHDWSTLGFEGVVWTVATQRPANLAELVDAMARVLDYPAVTRLPERDKVMELRSALAGHRYLVVLDGFETIEDQASLVTFVRSLPESNKTLLTSRHAVPDVRAIPLRGLTEAEAMRLLRGEAERIGVDIDDVAEDLQALYQLTGGLPLALKWALGLIRQGYDVSDVVATLQSAEGEVFEVIMGRTWERLTESARTLLMVMPCFAAPVTKQRMRSAAGLTVEEFNAAVEKLINGSLLEPHGSIRMRTFVAPPLLRAFANHHLLAVPELERGARERLSMAYRTLLQDCRHGYADGFDRIEDELENILDTIDWCYASQKWTDVVEFVDGIADFLWARGYWSERIKRASQGLDAARHLHDLLSAGRFAYFIGWVYSRWDDQEEARRWATEAQEVMAPAYGHDNPYALQLRGLARFREVKAVPPATAKETAAFIDAENLLRHALSLLKQDTRLPDVLYLMTILKDNLGDLYRDWGRDDDARSLYRAVLTDAENNGWDDRRATATGDLADLAYKAGEDAHALQLYEMGLAYALRIKRLNTVAQCRLGLGRTLLRKGDPTAAYEHLREAIAIYRRLGEASIVENIEKDVRLPATVLSPTTGEAPEFHEG